MKTVHLQHLISPAQVNRAGNGDYPVLSMTMKDGLVEQAERFKKRIASLDTSTYKVVQRGQLVVGFPIDEGVLDFQGQFDSAIVSPAYTIWDVQDEEVVDRDYLKKYLTSPSVIGYYKAKMRGSTARRRSLPAADFKALPVPLPSIPEQRRIAAILDEADSLRAKRQQVLTHLNELTQSIFHDMFAGARSEVVPAAKIMPKMRNGLSPTTSGTHQAQVLTLSAITRGKFDPSAVKPGAFVADPPSDKRITNRDFLMCRGNGNKKLVGVGTYSLNNHPELVFPDTVIAGIVDTNLVTMAFLEAAWKQQDVRTQIESVARTTNGTYKVNQKTLASIQVSVPPLEQQKVFEDSIAGITQAQDAVQRAAVADDELFASLQSRAFRGEL